jgi:hypothetical protein
MIQENEHEIPLDDPHHAKAGGALASTPSIEDSA